MFIKTTWADKPTGLPASRSYRQQGATLIEAMVAIFVLAFGVLTLMAAQLRAVSSVQEAENQTIVAQAAQTLMEGMLANPVIGRTASDAAIRTYDDYFSANRLASVADNVNEYCAQAGAASGNYALGVISKASLAHSQLCRFNRDLQSKLPNANPIRSGVCRGDPASGRCNQAPNVYLIVVEWGMQAADKTGAAQAPADASGVMNYRYALPLQD